MVAKRLSAMALGVLAGMIGFSFALATSPGGSEKSADVTTIPRTVGTGLKFSNPFLLPGQDAGFPSGGATSSDPSGFDLGDACYGSMIVRYLTALDGVQPYAFTSTTIGTTGLNLGLTGRVFGVIPPTLGTSARFNATVKDAAGVTRVGTFRVGTFPALTPFRFAHDRLSDARVGLDYITNIQVLGGDPALTTFSVVPGSVTFNSAAVTDMESMGIRLFEDGTIAGRPIKSGVLNFTARAQKSGGPLANNRSNTSPDQPLSINIAGLANIESQLATVSSTITGNIARPGHDTFSYNGVINSNGLSPRDFANQLFTLRLGGKTFTTTLDSRGQAHAGNLRVAMTGPEGVLRVSLRNQDFGALFAALPDLSKKVVVVEMQIGDMFMGTEPLYYSVVNRHGRFRLIYGVYRSRQIGGLFQIVAILGDDSSSGTAFKTKFVVSQVPDSSSESFGDPSDAVINIGPGFSEDVHLFRGKGFFSPPGIAAIKIQPSRKIGQFQTYHLPSSQTGIIPARNSGNTPQTFLLGMKITTNTLTFNGVASQRIFPIFRRH